MDWRRGEEGGGRGVLQLTLGLFSRLADLRSNLEVRHGSECSLIVKLPLSLVVVCISTPSFCGLIFFVVILYGTW